MSMTFKTAQRMIAVMNETWAELLIAEENTWEIKANPSKK